MLDWIIIDDTYDAAEKKRHKRWLVIMAIMLFGLGIQMSFIWYLITKL